MSSNLFFYPNRPTLVPPDPLNPSKPSPNYINSLEQSGKYIGEFKWNGDNTTIYTYPDRPPAFYNRTGQPLSYKPLPDLLKELSVFPPWCVLNGELMDRHTKKVKDLLILHCAMAWDNKILNGKTWQDSRNLLLSMSLPQTKGTCLDYDNHLLVAENHTKDFWGMFDEARACDGAIEGIVLKNPTGKLYFSTSPIRDVSWMLKIRKPSKKYRY